MPTVKSRRIYVEGLPGQKFEADVPCGTPLSKLAADFFESQGWPLQDERGRGQRAVVELVNPANPDETMRLNGEQDICQADVKDGDTLRVFPEAIAAAVNQHDRVNALVADHHNLLDLAARDPAFVVKPNRGHAPDQYTVTLRCPGFVGYNPSSGPRRGDEHQVEITLGADYPREAPRLRWLTPIFHPNIKPDGDFVCIGELRERWRPGLGLARLVQMLAEMVQYRNFNPRDGCNLEASRWAADPANRDCILAIGGHPFQGPIEEFQAGQDASRPPVAFKPVGG
jgi:ubiquitin-protein ligase